MKSRILPPKYSVIATLVCATLACAQSVPIVTGDARVDQLLSQMTLEEKLSGQKQIKALEALRNGKRRSLFDAQDEIDKQRAELIAQIEAKLEQKTDLTSLFTIRWALA